ncbi:FGGY-family carbohydrate kinase [Halovulum sp. GXIMD14794]
MTAKRVAVIDIGKTNAKLAVVDTGTMRELGVLTRPNTVIDAAPYPHFDVDGIWSFLTEALAALHRAHGIEAISVTTHGASGALLDPGGGLACPVLDYEHDGPDALATAYDALRPGFEVTGSPRLGMGLNLGAQLHWLLETQRGLAGRLGQVVTYPQFWSGRLTGRYHCEYTSLGCHTDLWAPGQGGFSPLVERLGLGGHMAALARADDSLGPILPEVARATGLRPDTPVFCGIHDSNASLLPHLRSLEPPLSVVSTGTWVICMAIGGRTVTLDPDRDTLINVNALGAPTPSARFMGGREYEMLRGETADPTADDVAKVLSGAPALLPAVDPGSGPFRGRTGGWASEGLNPGEKGAALSFYLALMTAECLDLIGATGATVVEGPFARNRPYLDMLAAVTQRPVQYSSSATGTSQGAALLAAGAARLSPPPVHAEPTAADRLAAYAGRWRAAVQ